jgi:hypothetical protein
MHACSIAMPLQVANNGSVISQLIGTAAEVLQAGADVFSRIADALGLDSGLSSDQLRQASQQAVPAIQSGGALSPAQNISGAGAGGWHIRSLPQKSQSSK